MPTSLRWGFIAACMMHVEGFYSIKSPAFKHNNPGNIMMSKPDKTFVLRTYPTLQDGFNALVEDIMKNTGTPLGKFIAKYAPPNENDTAMYINVVCTLTGIKPEELI